MRVTVLCTTLVVAAACVPVDRKPPVSDLADTTADTTATAPAAPAAPVAAGGTKGLTVAGFSTPESVLHDSTQDIYFVSNINGSPTAKDNNGFISRVRPDGAVENLKFIEGGRAGVTLNAPKGLALLGDTLWVADIDMVRAFNARTGAVIDSVKLDSAVFLNDVAVAATGAIYITDTGIRFDDVGFALLQFGVEGNGNEFASGLLLLRGAESLRVWLSLSDCLFGFSYTALGMSINYLVSGTSAFL